jgi:hypothetical protein
VTTIAIMAICIGCIVAQRFWYTAKMYRLGASLIGEAYRCRQDYPDEYPAYRREAVAALKSHGCGDLIADLPNPEL